MVLDVDGAEVEGRWAHPPLPSSTTNDEELRRDLLKLVDSHPEAISVEEGEWTRSYGLVLSDLSPSLSHHLPCLPHSLPTNVNWD